MNLGVWEESIASIALLECPHNMAVGLLRGGEVQSHWEYSRHFKLQNSPPLTHLRQ